MTAQQPTMPNTRIDDISNHYVEIPIVPIQTADAEDHGGFVHIINLHQLRKHREELMQQEQIEMRSIRLALANAQKEKHRVETLYNEKFSNMDKKEETLLNILRKLLKVEEGGKLYV